MATNPPATLQNDIQRPEVEGPLFNSDGNGSPRPEPPRGYKVNSWVVVIFIIAVAVIAVLVIHDIVAPLISKFVEVTTAKQLHLYLRYIGIYGSVFLAGLGIGLGCRPVGEFIKKIT